MLIGSSVSTIKVHWRHMCEGTVVGDEDRGAPEVSICWREVSTDEGSSAGIILLQGADIRAGDNVEPETGGTMVISSFLPRVVPLVGIKCEMWLAINEVSQGSCATPCVAISCCSLHSEG